MADAGPLPEAERARLQALPLSYPVGPGIPTGYVGLARSTRLGQGRETFERAVAAIMGWQVQLRSGTGVLSSDRPLLEGTVARLSVPVGPLRFRAFCRVVEVYDEPDRGGFCYGTLPGHPESGRESFVASIAPSGEVTFEIEAFSRPASWFARLGGPLTRRAQDAMTERYLRALLA